MSGTLVVRRLGPGDAHLVMAAADLFDNPPRDAWAAAFLAEPSHHLILAQDDEHAIGFVTGVELIHPDKGTEMFVYELGVAQDHRRQGVATALLQELISIARERRCYGMWVLTDSDNVAAVSTYLASGGHADGEHLMLTWDWSQPRG